MSEYLIRKKDIKTFSGYMTNIVQAMYAENRNQIKFRSTYKELATVSRIGLKNKRKVAAYATVDTADAFKALVDENPRATITELLDLARKSGKGELVDVTQYFVDNTYKSFVPIVELDNDVKKK